MDDAKILLSRNAPERLHEPEFYTEYFQMLFRDVDLDKKGIQPYRCDLDYPRVAAKYKLIEDTLPVVIPTYDNHEGERRLQQHLKKPSPRDLEKTNAFRCEHELSRPASGKDPECLEEVSIGLFRWIGGYDDKTHRGIQGIVRDPADLYIGDRL